MRFLCSFFLFFNFVSIALTSLFHVLCLFGEKRKKRPFLEIKILKDALIPRFVNLEDKLSGDK